MYYYNYLLYNPITLSLNREQLLLPKIHNIGYIYALKGSSSRAFEVILNQELVSSLIQRSMGNYRGRTSIDLNNWSSIFKENVASFTGRPKKDHKAHRDLALEDFLSGSLIFDNNKVSGAYNTEWIKYVPQVISI